MNAFYKGNSRRVILLILMIGFVFGAAACQPTPEQDVVVAKDEKAVEAMIEKAGDADTADEVLKPLDYDAPERLVFSLETMSIYDMPMYIELDADVVLPDYTLPMVTVVPKRQTLSQIQDVLNIVNPERQPLYYSMFAEQVRTKKKIQAIIDSYTWEIGVASEEQYDGYKRFINTRESQIKELYKEMETAPDDYAAAALEYDFDAWKTERSVDHDGSVEEHILSKEDQQLAMNEGWALTPEMAKPVTLSETAMNKPNTSFHLGEQARPAIFSFLATDDKSSQQIDYLASGAQRTFADRDLSKGNDLKITVEEAETEAQKIVDVLDKNLTLNDIGVCRIMDFESEDLAYIHIGYELIYTREINGVNTNYGLRILDASTSQERIEGPQSAEYKKPYDSEYLKIAVNEDKEIEYIEYRSPMEVAEVLGTDTELLPFDEIVEKFKSQITYSGMDNRDALFMNINEVRLGLARIEKPNSDEYLLVPAWDFYGAYAVQYEEYGKTQDTRDLYLDDYRMGYSFLTINAVDGSIIVRDDRR